LPPATPLDYRSRDLPSLLLVAVVLWVFRPAKA